MAQGTPSATEEFGARFAAELARLSEGRLSASQIKSLGQMSRDELVQAVCSKLSWLSPESVELHSSRGPEEFARGVVREQVRESGGEPHEGGLERSLWLADLLNALVVFR